ncbi:hypothetical protein EDI_144110 [Entamoeba dispar SAW760]|uniref:Uncharacterized protein n=1 Tax=Entamoeba dispar (strain ATCC PRA-260 / SAW760) TaxID=370354 RepID=B0EGL5_ENTDS|nr:uncharacterized protein EDI_144110 [Entamoeba dispar SAW760]EDR26330.1 hypothetical protein EDI_144110 [Entamoeba dispar SAW760]|eukprot:EDR26330.1 hypothetical protein EDI_144110 [Entamoeba dispar SAW760]
MISLILLLITLSFGKKCNEYNEYISVVDTVDSVFECIDELIISEDNKKSVINDLKRNLESYVYKDILKNPPTGSYYYEKVDIDDGLNKINMASGSVYEFYSQIQNLFISAKDPLLSLSIKQNHGSYRNYIAYFYYFLPFNIMIDKEKHMYLIPKYYYKNVKIDIPTEIENNKDIYVKSINGNDPFEIIREFGNKYSSFKSPHAQFTNSKSSILDNSFTQGNLLLLPLSNHYLNTPITITWENDESVDVHYNLLKLSNYQCINQEDKIILSSNENYTNINNKRNEYGDKYDNIYCKVSNNNINTLVIKGYDINKDLYLLQKCIELFDSNEYPIQVILPENKDGSEELGIWIQKLLTPNYDANLLSSARESDNTLSILKKGYMEYFVDPKTCEKRGVYGDEGIEIEDCMRRSTEKDDAWVLYRYCIKRQRRWYTKPKTIKYGDIKHKITQISEYVSEPPIQPLKHQRKPTKIIIYTYSFCYSTCSFITKGLKEWGGAIIVGFDGDPNGKDEEIEVGQAPSNRMMNIITEKQYDYKPLEFSLSYSILETFKHNYKYNENIPREFIKDVIDERVNIYPYVIGDEIIEEFEEETKKIVEKYQTKCNPNNKRLVKIDNKCDKEINIKHGHGGYECGDNGEWSTKCVLAYCDSGYKFDYNKNKCVKGICAYPSSGNRTMIINLVMVIVGLMMIIL